MAERAAAVEDRSGNDAKRELSRSIRQSLRCPIRYAKIAPTVDAHVCSNPSYGQRFRIAGGVPILINGSSSVAILDDDLNWQDPDARGMRSRLKTLASRLGDSPGIGRIDGGIPRIGVYGVSQSVLGRKATWDNTLRALRVPVG